MPALFRKVLGRFQPSLELEYTQYYGVWGGGAAPYPIPCGRWELGLDFVLTVHILAGAVAVWEKPKSSEDLEDCNIAP